MVLGLIALVPVAMLAFLVTMGLHFARGQTAAPAAPPADPRVPVELFARLMPADTSLVWHGWKDRYHGMVRLADGWFFWEPGSARDERWAVPVTDVQVAGVRGATSFSGAGLDLVIRGRAWRLTVSDKPIKRRSRNSFTPYREAGFARAFAGHLLALGAHPSTRSPLLPGSGE